MYLESLKLIKNAKNVALISHINPDCDALGSSLAMHFALKSIGINTAVVNVSPLPQSLDFLPGFKHIKAALPKECDLVVSFDCGNFERLGFERNEVKLINIDHHISNTNYGDINLIEAKAASTSVVVRNFMKQNDIPMSSECAICVYAALATDTGFFQYENVNEEAFNVAAECMKAGAKPDFVSSMLNQREPLSKLRLTAMILSTVELKLDGAIAYAYVTQDMLERCGSTRDEADGIVETLRNLATVEIGMLLREDSDRSVRGSLRSKSGVNVNKIAALFGGGGHMKAAGFTIRDDIDVPFVKRLDTIVLKILNEIKKELNES